MSQKEIIKYCEDVGGLCCKNWSIREIKDYLKAIFGSKQRVYHKTCCELKKTALMYQQ